MFSCFCRPQMVYLDLCFGSLFSPIGHVLAFTVWQSSQAISGSLALLARGRRLPHVVQKRRPSKAMLGWECRCVEKAVVTGVS